ncbi:hypothetical protein AAG570_008012 [Ranatra chinensis]|uniref:Vacuolar fusion protein MON1 homolog n=1 Tax=Ranatra chinensis TaxID=642074 RepID=A0ABD0XTL2_9HEMI
MNDSTEPHTDDEATAADQFFDTNEWKKHDNHIFILSSAGKPVYSRYGCEDKLVTLFGVMQALVSFVQDSDDSIQAIYAGKSLVVFLIRGPIILVSVSRSKESVQHLSDQLTYVYNQVVSVLTLTQVTRIFEQRRNYDLRRLLTGSERLINHLLDFTENEPEFTMNSVCCLPLSSSVRETISNAIISCCSKIKNLVFGILITGNRLITLVRLKKYHLKPCDLHLIFNMVSGSESFKTAENWTPICLPNFDSSGFLHAHVSYLADDCQACLLLLTVDKDLFFPLSAAKKNIVKVLRRTQCLDAINKALKTPLSVPDDIQTVHHFLYKCKKTSQMLAPAMTTPYHTTESANELLKQYEEMHSAIHQVGAPLNLIFQHTCTEIMLGWVNDNFEIYITFKPLISKSNCIEAVDKILKWIQKEEDKLFMLNMPTF